MCGIKFGNVEAIIPHSGLAFVGVGMLHINRVLIIFI